MAVLSKEDLIKKVTEYIGETPDDNGVSLLEDVTDTLNQSNETNVDWKEKYEENDKNWRKRYIDRFNGKVSEEDDPETPPETKDEKTTFESLFKEN